MDNRINTYNNILKSYQNLRKDEMNSMAAVITIASACLKTNKFINQKTSEQYNPLLYFNIRETLNSRILADLLNPKHKHGQKDLFLSEYLKSIQLEYNESDIWDIRCESENVDIVLTATKPRRVVVIENKINGACDQPNQLYRYYQLKIEQHYAFEEKKEHPERYKIVYLTKHAEKKCSDNSIFSADSKDRVPEELIVNQTFSLDIKNILENCLTQIDKDNFRMKAFINFFIEQTTI
ncbi:MAG TPA: PD-(D/E)XK nuclease family protein [Flavobacterium sp.]|nr:PD-(D/E)XK nuclease family protein [Flavobacterium sp.]HRB66250.1 PD-(D/E)XK nuclease family protein [Chitinophagales bacterium]HRB91868.1 PD-(D/E)XK nuclease family protein [Chitinophagales bacterium]